jgi:hypothetical protein
LWAITDYDCIKIGEVMQEGPFFTAVKAKHEGVIKQEFVTYYINEDGNIAKSTAVRKFFPDDYVDSSSKEIFSQIK